MLEQIATVLVHLLYAYAVIGFLFALGFVFRGAQKVDRQAAGTGIAFRLLIVPGTIAFWPLLFGRWLRAAGDPSEERNPHR